ncbi:MAG TPA: DUF2911 domain-containing protein [Gemmatimonadaceae bacterium]|nr:DUF2911 domain-containing protein [Gemmatimonadaceae bacterium]
MRPARVALAAGGLAALLCCGRGGPAGAQAIPRSQLASVSQTVAGTRIDIVYRRPTARGRALFGALVPWGRAWSPASDSAARVTVSGPIEVNGSPLAAGSYSLWAIPDSAAWTVIFSSVPEVFHTRYPAGRDALRVQATPARGEHVETLQLAFPMVDADSARLELRWGETVVPLTIRARPGGGR